VYGVITPFIFGWTLYWFAWILPSWLKFLTLGELGAIMAYFFTINFAETLSIILALMVLAAILPASWLKSDFILRGSLASLCLFGFLIFIELHNTPLWQLPRVGAITGVIFIATAFLFIKIHFLRKALEGLADNATIFSYITIPVSILSLMVVIIRNIPWNG
jgi:hypothetical protein